MDSKYIFNRRKSPAYISLKSAKMPLAAIALYFFASLFFCATSQSAEVRSASIDDLTITINMAFLTKPEWVMLNSPGGYLPLIVDVTNHGEDRNVEVRVAPRSSRNWPGGAQNIVRRSRIRSGESARLILPLMSSDSKVSNSYYGQISLSVNGRRVRLEDYMNTEFTVMTSTFSYHNVDPREWVATEIVETASGWQELGNDEAVFQINPSIMPANWIYYDPTAPIFISRETMAGIRPELRSTLTDFVAVGGNLVITGVSEDNVGNVRSMLFGESSPASTRTIAQSDNVRDSYMLGNIIYEAASDSLRDSPGFAKRMRMGRFHPRTFHTYMSGWNEHIPGLGRPPIYTFIAVMVLFTIVIGPVNYIILRIKRKMELFLVTVPLIAGVTTLFLFAYAIFHEGLGARGSLWSFTLLDEGSRKAVTFGSMTYYTGLTPRGGLMFSPQTSVIPMRPERSSLDTHVIDWTEGQNLATNWIKARTLVSLRATSVSRAESRRRLDFARDDEDKPLVVNGIGADISNLYVHMPDGVTYRADSVKNGGRAELKPDNGFASQQYEMQPLYYTLPAAVRDMISNVEGGFYLCSISDPVFLDKGLDKVEREQSGFILVGLFRGGL